MIRKLSLLFFFCNFHFALTAPAFRQFTDVSEALGFSGGGKAAFGDYDDDGFVDLLKENCGETKMAADLWKSPTAASRVAKSSGVTTTTMEISNFLHPRAQELSTRTEATANLTPLHSLNCRQKLKRCSLDRPQQGQSA